MKRPVLILACFALGACEQPAIDDHAQVEELATRISALEREQGVLQQALLDKEKEAQNRPAQERMAFELEGASGSHSYTTKEGCEAALQVLAADRAADDASGRMRGVIYTSRPVLSCLPI